jgi:hypothetical protein
VRFDERQWSPKSTHPAARTKPGLCDGAATCQIAAPDPPIRRSADPPIRRSADPPIHRFADSPIPWIPWIQPSGQASAICPKGMAGSMSVDTADRRSPVGRCVADPTPFIDSAARSESSTGAANPSTDLQASLPFSR